MIRTVSLTRLTTRLLIVIPFAALLYNFSPMVAAASAPSLGSASSFAVLAGTAVTCTDSTVSGDVGVWPGSAVTQTNCTIAGTVHAGDGVARRAYLDFIGAFDNLRDNPPACDAVLTGTLANEVLTPGVCRATCFGGSRPPRP
jgi:hypothetical protein